MAGVCILADGSLLRALRKHEYIRGQEPEADALLVSGLPELFQYPDRDGHAEFPVDGNHDGKALVSFEFFATDMPPTGKTYKLVDLITTVKWDKDRGGKDYDAIVKAAGSKLKEDFQKVVSILEEF